MKFMMQCTRDAGRRFILSTQKQHNNQHPQEETSQVQLSYELILLLRWIVNYEQDTLKKFINRAMAQGLSHQLLHILNHPKKNKPDDQSGKTIMDFFTLMEFLLFETMHEKNIKSNTDHKLTDLIENMDLSNYDYNTIAKSVEKTRDICWQKPKNDVKSVLCKELLRRWKPSKKLKVN